MSKRLWRRPASPTQSSKLADLPKYARSHAPDPKRPIPKHMIPSVAFLIPNPGESLPFCSFWSKPCDWSNDLMFNPRRLGVGTLYDRDNRKQELNPSRDYPRRFF